MYFDVTSVRKEIAAPLKPRLFTNQAESDANVMRTHHLRTYVFHSIQAPKPFRNLIGAISYYHSPGLYKLMTNE